MNILITGVGGPLGQSIMKAARSSTLVEKIIGTDIHQMSVGLYTSDRGHVIPGARKDPEGYITALKEICAKEKISAILVGSEPELEVVCRWRSSFWSELHVVVVVCTEEILTIALDKFLTCEALERNGLSHPRYALLSDWNRVELLIAEVGFPLIVKPRRGSGSQQISRVHSKQQLELLSKMNGAAAAVVQECLLPDDQEYTLGIFTCTDGSPLDPIIMRRELAAGLTYRANIVRHEALEHEARKVASTLRIVGPCNLQMRLIERGPVTFEINPRFSSTTSVRAHFGYNEVEMALRNLVLGESLPPPNIKGGHVMRYWEEFYREELLDFSR